MRFLLSISLVVALIIFSCKSEAPEAPPARDLVETHWLIASVEGDTSGISGKIPRPYLLIRPGVDGMRFQVHAGCNNILGHIQTDTVSTLRFSRIASTKKACLRMALEERVQRVLPDVDAFRIVGEQLRLMTGDEVVAVLNAGPEAD